MKTRNATRASEGLPRKRPSYDLEDLRPSRPKKQIRQPPKKKFPLMKLPAEIRLKILRELLWHPQPLARETREISNLPPFVPYLALPMRTQPRSYVVEQTNYSFYPAILAVCRQLNEEGSPVLYEENTVDVTVYYDPLQYEFYRCDWMGYSSALASTSKSLSLRARKLRITVQVRSPKHVTSKTMRRFVRELVKVLQANPQWCNLDVRLEDHVPDQMRDELLSDEEDEIQLDQEILRPFNLLRRIQHVNFTGVSPQFAARLSNLVKSDCPVIDLPKMYDSLEDYFNTCVSDELREEFPDEYLDLAEDAMDVGNVTEFYKHRNKVMWEVEKSLRKEHADVFKHDPDPVSSRLSSHEFVADQERLKNMEEEGT